MSADQRSAVASCRTLISYRLAPNPASTLAHLALLIAAQAGATAVGTGSRISVDVHADQAVAGDQRIFPSKNEEFATSRCGGHHRGPTLLP